MKPLIGMATALVLASTAMSAPARAQQFSPADTADMQCFVLMSYLTGQTADDTTEQAGMVSGMMYFLGRLEGRTPGADWLTMVSNFILTVEDAEILRQGERCGGILQDRAQALGEWGESLSATPELAAD